MDLRVFSFGMSMFTPPIGFIVPRSRSAGNLLGLRRSALVPFVGRKIADILCRQQARTVSAADGVYEPKKGGRPLPENSPAGGRPEFNYVSKTSDLRSV